MNLIPAAFLIQFYIYITDLKRPLQIMLPIMWGETTWLNSQDYRWLGFFLPQAFAMSFLSFWLLLIRPVLLTPRNFTFHSQQLLVYA